MTKVSAEWLIARKKVLDEFWDDDICFETFKERIKVIDNKFKEKRG